MGKAHGTLFSLMAAIAVLSAFLTGMPVLSAQGIGTHASIRSFTMPQYHERDNRLQFIVYGATANNKGALVFLDDMIIDFMINNLNDVTKVNILSSAKPYPLTTPRREINAYWKDKTHSQGLVFSDSAILDKTAQILRSTKPVKFRSTFLDVDGVGFDAYQNRKFLHIRSKVKVFIRPEARKQAMSGKGSDAEGYRSAEDFLNEDIKQQSNKTTKE